MTAPNSGRHFDECPQHPENVVGGRPFCTAHEHKPPVCITCCYTDNGRCDCQCYQNVQPDLIARAKADVAEYRRMAANMSVNIHTVERWQELTFRLCAAVPELVAALEARPMHPVVDDLASERHEGWRDDNEQLRRDIRKAEDARDAALLAADKANEEVAELRRQQPDDDAQIRGLQ